MKNIHIVIEEELKQRFRDIAKSKGLSVSALIRLAVIEYSNKNYGGSS